MPEHVPVLLSDVLTGLHLQSNANVIDATLGGGGHVAAILEVTAPNGRVLGIEADRRTLTTTVEKLRSYHSRFVPAHGNFRDIGRQAVENNFINVQGVLFDLGLSSIALADPDRGFSFQHAGPLDMRFDPTSQTVTAADLVATRSESELANMFRELADEHQAQRIASAIVSHRRQNQLKTTADLSELVQSVKPRRGRTHPATQVFQALRMQVNDELGAIATALPQAFDLLAKDGRLLVITFHSIEDRLVKRWMKDIAASGQGTLLTKHVIVPSREEQLRNPRARSAKLRILNKN